MRRTVYLDNAATTRQDELVTKAMLPYMTDFFGNPSAGYTFAKQARTAVNEARRDIASLIGAAEYEIYFTSGGTESDNLAIEGILQDPAHLHAITSSIEHPAVLNTFRRLEKQGLKVTYIPPDEYGNISPRLVEEAIRPDTKLISVMFANNETGTIMQTAKLGQIAHDHGVVFHTDAVQALGHEIIDVKSMNIDLLSASAHKLNGPKGVGLLYVKSSVALKPYFFGGGQEKGLRPGTENVPGIAGFAAAARIAAQRIGQARGYYDIGDGERILPAQYIRNLRDRLISRVLSEIEGARLIGPDPFDSESGRRLDANAHFSFPGVEGTSLLIKLDMAGICCSTGSACSASSAQPSHVLKAMKLPDECIKGSVRFSLGIDTTIEDIDYTVDTLKNAVDELRSIRI